MTKSTLLRPVVMHVVRDPETSPSLTIIPEFVVTSVLLDYRPLIHGNSSVVTINGFHPCNETNTIFDCNFDNHTHSVGRLIIMHEIGTWCPSQIRCPVSGFTPKQVSINRSTFVSISNLGPLSDPVPRSIGVCVKPIQSNPAIDAGIVEWIEYHRVVVKAQTIVLYDWLMSDRLHMILFWYQKNYPGLIKLLPWRLPACTDVGADCTGRFIGFNGQLAAYQDCLLRLSGNVEWTMFVDVDEFIVFNSTKDSLFPLGDILDSNPIPSLQLAGVHFLNYFFRYCRASESHVPLLNNLDPSTHWALSGMARTRKPSGGFIDRSKMIINPLVVETMHVHWPNTLLNPHTEYDNTLTEYNQWWKSYATDLRLKIRPKLMSSLQNRIFLIRPDVGHVHHQRMLSRNNRDSPETVCESLMGVVPDQYFYTRFRDTLAPGIEAVLSSLQQK